MLLGDLNTQARFVELRQAIWSDGRFNGVPFSEYDLEYLLSRVRTEGHKFCLEIIPLLGRSFEACLVGGAFTCPTNFSKKGTSRLPSWLYDVFKRCVTDEGELLEKPDLTCTRYLRQFLMFDSKLISKFSKDQEASAWNGFKLRQEKLKSLRMQFDHPVLVEARRILSKTLKDNLLNDISPRQGPGAVYEGLDRDKKWDFKYWSASAERYYPYLEYGLPSRSFFLNHPPIKLRKDLCSKVYLVPKDFRGPRLICAESTVNQYLQQGQMLSLMSFMENSRLLKRSIRMKDQSFNQRRARVADSSDLVTLDLSNASDTLSATLVWYLFADLPNLRRRLFCTRSLFATFRNEKIRLYTFSPMGSAVCFPIETLVFWSLSMASLKLVRRHSSVWENASCVSVFGDDIIIPREAMDVLIGTLLTVGCEPNMHKTCWLTPFRESCGSEWFNGSTITIIRNRRYTYETVKSPDQYHVVLDLHRRLYLCGMRTTSLLLAEWAAEWLPVWQQSVPREVEMFHEGWLYSCKCGSQSEGTSWARCKCLHLPFEDGLTQRYPCSYQFPQGLQVSFPASHEFRGWFLQLSAIKADSLGKGDRLGFVGLPREFRLWSGLDLGKTSKLHDKQKHGREIDFLGNVERVMHGRARVKYEKRWNKHLFRMEVKVPTSHPVTREWRSSGGSRLLARLLGDTNGRVVKRGLQARFTWTYIPDIW